MKKNLQCCIMVVHYVSLFNYPSLRYSAAGYHPSCVGYSLLSLCCSVESPAWQKRVWSTFTVSPHKIICCVKHKSIRAQRHVETFRLESRKAQAKSCCCSFQQKSIQQHITHANTISPTPG
ncbi:hypothetical protein Y032_0044g1058 [Ancylostoma ceylanicum]|uniref:Uncharacterized protein n=1 Tax=Ancylostoma ceylanicum TaxID=53326 RepID=A0A016UDL4_9BILA|nr:hypothetical protein Y032_0044g1058 [Ancylostoma ceylanicum]